MPLLVIVTRPLIEKFPIKNPADALISKAEAILICLSFYKKREMNKILKLYTDFVLVSIYECYVLSLNFLKAQRTQTLERSETNKAYCLWPKSFLLFPSPPCPYTSITFLRPSCVFFSFILTLFVIFLLLLISIPDSCAVLFLHGLQSYVCLLKRTSKATLGSVG